MTGARRSSAQTSRLNSMISRIGEVATTEAVRKPPIATSGGADQSGGEISTAISPTTSPAPIVPTVSPLMTTSAVPLSMAYSEYPARPSAASNFPAGISASDATLATAASSSSGKSAKKRIAASRTVSIFPDYSAGPTYATSLQGRSPAGQAPGHGDGHRPVDHGFVVCWQALVVADGPAAPGDPRQCPPGDPARTARRARARRHPRTRPRRQGRSPGIPQNALLAVTTGVVFRFLSHQRRFDRVLEIAGATAFATAAAGGVLTVTGLLPGSAPWRPASASRPVSPPWCERGSSPARWPGCRSRSGS